MKQIDKKQIELNKKWIQDMNFISQKTHKWKKIRTTVFMYKILSLRMTNTRENVEQQELVYNGNLYGQSGKLALSRIVEDMLLAQDIYRFTHIPGRRLG